MASRPRGRRSRAEAARKRCRWRRVGPSRGGWCVRAPSAWVCWWRLRCCGSGPGARACFETLTFLHTSSDAVRAYYQRESFHWAMLDATSSLERVVASTALFAAVGMMRSGTGYSRNSYVVCTASAVQAGGLSARGARRGPACILRSLGSLGSLRSMFTGCFPLTESRAAGKPSAKGKAKGGENV